jgi:hypothetical protein
MAKWFDYYKIYNFVLQQIIINTNFPKSFLTIQSVIHDLNLTTTQKNPTTKGKAGIYPNNDSILSKSLKIYN